MSARAIIHFWIRVAFSSFRSCWKSLVLTDIAFKVIAFILLTPLLGVLFRLLLSASGSEVRSDLDILFFMLGPLGWICVIGVGALWLGIVALEQASLQGILAAKIEDKQVGFVAALRFAANHAWPVLRVTIRIVARTLLAMAPFLALAGVVYFTLLGDYDINYYLREKPAAFQVAVGIGVVIALCMAALLLRLFSGWFFALPLVLFEAVSPKDALKQSSVRAHGHRWLLSGWIASWGLAVLGLTSLATGAIGLLGRLLVQTSYSSLVLLAVLLGLIVLLGIAVNLAVNLVLTILFSGMLFNFYQEFGGKDAIERFRAKFTAYKSKAVFRMTRGRLVAAGVLGIAIAAVIGAGALRSVNLEDDVKIMAHRGSSNLAPENTLAAIRQAIEDKADYVEIDVQETADGEVVVMHDSDFMRVSGVDLKIWNATMKDLAEIDIGSWYSPDFKDERVATLDQVLAECKGKIGVNIELKYYGHDDQLEQRVSDIVDAHDMASSVMAMSLKMDSVRKMKAIRPDWKVGLLMSVSAGDLKQSSADFLAVNASFANRNMIQQAHKNGQEVFVWTVDDARTMSSMISQGVDGLLTNKPALARSVLDERAAMSVPDRLLLELAAFLGVPSEISEQ